MANKEALIPKSSTYNIKHCKHGPEEECTANCTYIKFTTDGMDPASIGYEKGGSSKRQDRIGFVRKVYGILLAQLGLTAVIVAAALNVDSLRGCEYGAKSNPNDFNDNCSDEDAAPKGLIGQLWIGAAIALIVALLCLICVPVGAQHDEDGNTTYPGKPLHMIVPYNYVLLLVFTISTSICVAKISLALSVGKPGVVFESVALTSAAVLGITIYAFTGFQKLEGVQEVSLIGPGLSAIGLIFGVTSFFVFAPNDRIGCERDENDDCKDEGSKMRLLYACLGVVLFAMIMLFDTAQVIGGKSIMFELGPETYILGAIQLYLEIINMFVLLMVVLGDAG